MTVVDAAFTPTPARAPVLADDRAAVGAAHRLARDWAVSGPRRDQDRQVPRAELEALGRSGLLGILVPADLGGPAVSAVTFAEVFATLAEADLGLAQIPQNHFGTVFELVTEEPQKRAFFLGETLRGARFGNANSEARKGGGRGPATTLTEDGAGFRINGVKRFCTGALTADWVPMNVGHPDGRLATAIVRAGTPGMELREDWDAYGQRATFSGTAVFEDVWVPREHVLEHSRKKRPVIAFRHSRSQITHAALLLGATRAIRTAADELAAAGGVPSADRSRFEAWREDLELDVHAAQVLVRRAARLIDEVSATPEPTEQEALTVAIAVDEAKTIAYDLAPQSADALAAYVTPELLRARAGFDRLWRNTRTHSLHDPVRWRRHYVGDHHLNGTPPPYIAALFESGGPT